jgi:hypothetical protein
MAYTNYEFAELLVDKAIERHHKHFFLPASAVRKDKEVCIEAIEKFFDDQVYMGVKKIGFIDHLMACQLSKESKRILEAEISRFFYTRSLVKKKVASFTKIPFCIFILHKRHEDFICASQITSFGFETYIYCPHGQWVDDPNRKSVTISTKEKTFEYVMTNEDCLALKIALKRQKVFQKTHAE